VNKRPPPPRRSALLELAALIQSAGLTMTLHGRPLAPAFEDKAAAQAYLDSVPVADEVKA